MDKISVPCYLENRISKDGKTYACFVIHICDGCDKVIFPDPAEKVLVNMLFNSSKTASKISIGKSEE